MQGGRQPSLELDSIRDTVPPDREGCCPALRRLVPVGFGAEAWTLFALSGPLVSRRCEGQAVRPAAAAVQV